MDRRILQIGSLNVRMFERIRIGIWNVPIVLIFSFGILLTDLNWTYWKMLIFVDLRKSLLLEIISIKVFDFRLDSVAGITYNNNCSCFISIVKCGLQYGKSHPSF